MSARDILMAAAGSSGLQKVVFAGGVNPPYIKASQFTGSALGAPYANPTVLPGGTVRRIAVSPDGSLVAAGGNAGTLAVYPWSNSGFGTRLTNPSGVLSGAYFSTAFSPNGKTLIATNVQSPFVMALKVSNGSLVSKYSNPSYTPVWPGNNYGCTFSPDGTCVFFTAPSGPSGTGHVVTAYAWSDETGFGAKYADPSMKVVFISGSKYATDVCLNPEGSIVAFTDYTSPGVHAYQWSSSSGWGSKYSNPVQSLVSGQVGFGIKFSPSGDYLYVNQNGGGCLKFQFSYESGFGTRTLINNYGLGGALYQLAISKDGTVFASANGSNMSVGNGLSVNYGVIAMSTAVAFNF